MKRVLPVAALAVVLCAGCVERCILIRSDPPGAPVWVDEEYVGQTAMVHAFAHYGTRRIRVGPVRDESGKMAYEEQEMLLETRAPWYQTFPLDFFAEVLWPGRIIDWHVPPVFHLDRASPRAADSGEEDLKQLLKDAESFRRRALAPIPAEGDQE